MDTPQLNLITVKVVALAATDIERAKRFYGITLGLERAQEGGQEIGFALGDTVLMIKDDWYGQPTAEPNPRITLQTADARQMERALRALEVTISDPVELYEGAYYVGAFLDSEGNKLWFCSNQ